MAQSQEIEKRPSVKLEPGLHIVSYMFMLMLGAGWKDQKFGEDLTVEWKHC